MSKTLTVPTTAPTILSFVRRIATLSKVADAPANGADFSLDAYADIETGARLIGQRASDQLKAIVSRRQAS